jgi:hypothetical protein
MQDDLLRGEGVKKYLQNWKKNPTVYEKGVLASNCLENRLKFHLVKNLLIKICHGRILQEWQTKNQLRGCDFFLCTDQSSSSKTV